VNVSEQVKDGELGELANAFDDMAEALFQKEKEQLAAAEALREASQRAERNQLILESVIQQMPVGVILTDGSGVVAKNNAAMDRIWKREMFPHENVESHHYVAYHKDGREYQPEEWPLTRALRNAEDIVGEEMLILRGDGTKGTVLVSSSPIQDKSGQIIAGVVVDVDITDRKRAEEALRKAKDELEERVKERTYELYEESLYARSLIEASLDPLVTISVDGKITDVNHASEEVTGVPREQLIGSDFSEYFTEPGKARVGYEEVFRHGVVRDYPLELKHRDGHVTPVLYNASVYRDDTGRTMGVFAAARDITKRKQAEVAQRRLASELAMAEERERKRIAGVLHDDIAQILAAARMRLDMLQDIPTDQALIVKEAKSFLLQSLQETRALMNDLGNPVLFELGLEAACLALARQMMERHHIRISCDIQDAFEELNPDVKTILYQVIKELLNNVVKHSQAHNAQLMIDMENGHVRVKVTDDGVGFDPRMLGTPGAEGGFGLYSIRERLSAVDGSLSIESTPGTGTVVTAILPEALD
jgi:PAS domain S-box-containing protein